MVGKRAMTMIVATFAIGGLLVGGIAYGVDRFADDSPQERHEEEAFTQAHGDEVPIGRERAEAIATGAGGSLLQSELERAGSSFVWEVEIEREGEVREIVVDAQDGRILGSEAEGSEGSDAEGTT